MKILKALLLLSLFVQSCKTGGKKQTLEYNTIDIINIDEVSSNHINKYVSKMCSCYTTEVLSRDPNESLLKYEKCVRETASDTAFWIENYQAQYMQVKGEATKRDVDLTYTSKIVKDGNLALIDDCVQYRKEMMWLKNYVISELAIPSEEIAEFIQKIETQIKVISDKEELASAFNLGGLMYEKLGEIKLAKNLYKQSARLENKGAEHGKMYLKLMDYYIIGEDPSL